ncbi:MAG: transposase [Lachnospiraceae bacterium]|nr:transposase [Lachnospiraceae bacterium]
MRRRKEGGSPNRAYRYRLYPSDEQKVFFAKSFGCCRFIYNKMLADKIAAYKEKGTMRKCTPAQYKKEFPWLKEVDSLALANVQLDLEQAYHAFFTQKKAGFPKFKSKKISRRSYTTNLVNGNIVVKEKSIRLPKAGEVKAVIHRPVPAGYRLKSVTVSQEPSGEYYASVLYEYEAVENQAVSEKEDLQILGIDFAMHGLGVMSDGNRCEYPGYYHQASERLAREQRKLSHCEKGSHNYEKQKRKVAARHQKVKNQRKDFQHKLSHQLTEKYDVIVIEDLDMKAMSQCLNFGKSVMDNGYGQFVSMLEYKLREKGGKLIRIDRYYPSSKKCSRCGEVKQELKLSERIYRCRCGNEMDRDVNAAINIRKEGKRMLYA